MNVICLEWIVFCKVNTKTIYGGDFNSRCARIHSYTLFLCFGMMKSSFHRRFHYLSFYVFLQKKLSRKLLLEKAEMVARKLYWSVLLHVSKYYLAERFNVTFLRNPKSQEHGALIFPEQKNVATPWNHIVKYMFFLRTRERAKAKPEKNITR